MSEDHPKVEGSDRTQHRLTRRLFLKTTVRLAVAGGVEAFLGPIEKTVDYLSKTEKLDEGSLLQRLSILKKLIRDVTMQLDSEERQKKLAVLQSWIKFNGAEVYAYSEGYEMAGAFLTHFLYGEGEPLDVSKMYQDAIVFHSDTDLSTEAERQAFISSFVGETLSSRYFDYPEYYSMEMLPQVLIAPLSIPHSNRKLTSRDTISFKKVAETLGKSALYFALNNHTIAYTGRSVGISVNTNRNGAQYYSGEFVDSKIEIYDRYDWSDQSIESRRRIRDLGEAFLRSIKIEDPEKLLDSIFTHEFLNRDLIINDQDGKILVDNGYGREFDVHGSFKIDRHSVYLNIPAASFQ